MTMSALGNEQEKRTARAMTEGPSYEWAKTPYGWVVQTLSGRCYQVNERVCTCEDFRHNCIGTETRCKHIIALRHKLLAEGPLPPRAATKEEREDAAFWRVYGG